MKSVLLALVLLFSGIWLQACSSDSPKTNAATSCKADAECSTGHCDPKAGCVECVFDSHCGAGKRCSSGSCYAPQSCDRDDECKGTSYPVCDPARRECVVCIADQDCGDSAHCRDSACVPFAKCASEKDCSGGLHCDLGSGECVACLTKGDCAAGSDCVAGQCQLLCKTEAECAPSASHCTASGHCGECATDQHCPDLYHCQAGACVADACEQGSVTCSQDGAAVATCSANGDGLMMSACATGQTCAVANGVAQCSAWVCKPSADRCNADGSGVEHCAADGLSVTSEDACADGEHCVAGHCAARKCEPNAAYCQDGNSYLCSYDGTEGSLVQQCTGTDSCDSATGKCVQHACVPNATGCGANNDVTTCRADGSGFDSMPCGATQTCTEGACKDVKCRANENFCDGDSIRICNATGTDSSLFNNCNGSRCSSDGYVHCVSNSCVPGTKQCDGNKATICAADGSGLEPNPIDCGSVGGYCDSATGTCKPQACKPSEMFCNGKTYIYQCDSLGKGSSVYKDCYYSYPYYQQCNPLTVTCGNPVCTPNQSTCSNNVVQKCDATGFSSMPGEDCTASGKVCVGGACLTKVCTPGYICKGGNVEACGDGTSSSLYDTCAPGEYCQEGSYYCHTDVCTAGTPLCNGANLSTCKSDGSGPADAGKACDAGKTCVNGACQATICTPNTPLCLSGSVQLCNASGTGATLTQYCLQEQYCDAATTTCKLDVCPSGKPYCDGETLKSCKADGSGPVDAGTTCNSANKVCTVSGCAATAVDPLGDAGTTSSLFGTADYFFGDVIKVTQGRKLTKIEADLAVAGGPVSAHWLVYSSVDGVTYYQASDTPVSLANTADAWVSSPALSVELAAGVYYLVGIELAPTNPASVTYHSSAVTTPSMSFGQVLGSSTKNVAGPPASFAPTRNSSLYGVRISSTLP